MLYGGMSNSEDDFSAEKGHVEEVPEAPMHHGSQLQWLQSCLWPRFDDGLELSTAIQVAVRLGVGRQSIHPSSEILLDLVVFSLGSNQTWMVLMSRGEHSSTVLKDIHS